MREPFERVPPYERWNTVFHAGALSFSGSAIQLRCHSAALPSGGNAPLADLSVPFFRLCADSRRFLCIFFVCMRFPGSACTFFAFVSELQPLLRPILAKSRPILHNFCGYAVISSSHFTYKRNFCSPDPADLHTNVIFVQARRQNRIQPKFLHRQCQQCINKRKLYGKILKIFSAIPLFPLDKSLRKSIISLK